MTLFIVNAIVIYVLHQKTAVILTAQSIMNKLDDLHVIVSSLPVSYTHLTLPTILRV